MLVNNSASLRTGIVRIVAVTALVVASLAFATGTAAAHGTHYHYGGWWGHIPHGHAWGWWSHAGHCDRKPTPTASFSADPAATFVGEAVQFDASASTGGTINNNYGDPVVGEITKYDWAFGDGATATVTDGTATLSHTYSEAGTFSVTLTVTNDAGKTATATKSIVVSPQPVPTADFTVDPTVPLATHLVHYDASTSTGGESSGRVGTIVSYDWSYGDGASDTGVTPTHAYADPNSYEVTLTVTNDAGKTATASKTVEVAPLPKPIPTAAFTYSPGAPVAERVVLFDGSSSSGGQTEDTTGTIVSYSWSFGDNTNATGATTQHVFNTAGTFPVTLTVTNDAGESDSATQNLTVFPAPPPYDPGGEPTAAFDGDPVVVNPLAPQSLLTAKSGSSVVVGFSVGFDLPAGSDPAEACNGKGSVAVSSTGLKKVNAKSGLSETDSGCQLRFKVKLPKGYSGKKAKFSFAFGGNDAVAAWSLTRKLAVK